MCRDHLRARWPSGRRAADERFQYKPQRGERDPSASDSAGGAPCSRSEGYRRRLVEPSSSARRESERRGGSPHCYSSVLLSRVSHVSTSTPCASASFRTSATSAFAMHFESSASNAASSARSLSPPIAARCLSWSPTDMSTRAGEPSVGMIPRITGGLDSTGCSDHRTSFAENSGLMC